MLQFDFSYFIKYLSKVPILCNMFYGPCCSIRKSCVARQPTKVMSGVEHRGRVNHRQNIVINYIQIV